jgi:hypothetical protein
MGEQMKDVHDEKRNSWPAICSEFWPKNLWKMVLHNFRSFMWIFINLVHRSVRDYTT